MYVMWGSVGHIGFVHFVDFWPEHRDQSEIRARAITLRQEYILDLGPLDLWKMIAGHQKDEYEFTLD